MAFDHQFQSSLATYPSRESLGTVDCTHPILCTPSKLVNIWKLFLTPLCFSVLSKSILSLFLDSSLKVFLTTLPHTQYRVPLTEMWSPKISRLVASKVRERGKVGGNNMCSQRNIWKCTGCFLVVTVTWGDNVQDGPTKLTIVLHHQHPLMKQRIIEICSHNSLILQGHVLLEPPLFEPEEDLTQESSYINPKALTFTNLFSYFF